MSMSKFTDLLSFSNTKLSESIIEAENELFSLRFKKATRQNFKSHEIKKTKRRIAQLKTLLTIRFKNSD